MRHSAETHEKWANGLRAELLIKVQKQIELCESIKKNQPLYYDEHWAFLHHSLILIRKELEEKNGPNQNHQS